jgi:DNA-binding NarL/FixJ family response regulator
MRRVLSWRVRWEWARPAYALTGNAYAARTPALIGPTAPELTPRQREIAYLAASGLTNRDIADRLVVSMRTVANTLGAVYDKTGVNDRGDLARILDDRP